MCLFVCFCDNLFLHLSVPALSVGRTTGIVVEIGDGVTQVVAASDGFMDKVAIRRSDFGGQEVTMFLQKLLCDQGYSLTSRSDVVGHLCINLLCRINVYIWSYYVLYIYICIYIYI